MKFISSLAVFAALSMVPTADALVGSSWSMSNVPSTGLTDITFPLTIVAADHISGYYFAQQYSFAGGSNAIGYTGLQPRPDSNGKPILHAVFSSFVAGTTTTDSPNCSPGADGGAGVSCSVEWNGVYGIAYNLEVKNAGGQTWVGTVVNSLTGERVHIGRWTLPAGLGGIQDNQLGFVEWYPWNGGEPPNHCATLPYQQTVFGAPYTTHSGSVGTQSLAYEYGDCVGQVAFSTEKLGTGMINNCGFRGQSG